MSQGAGVWLLGRCPHDHKSAPMTAHMFYLQITKSTLRPHYQTVEGGVGFGTDSTESSGPVFRGPSPCVVAMDTSAHTWAPLAFSECPASPTPDHTSWLQPCSYQAQTLESCRRLEGANPGTSPHRDPHPVRRHLLGCWGSCMRLLIPLHGAWCYRLDLNLQLIF